MFKVPLLRHQRYISPSPLTSRVKSNDKMYLTKNVDFDTFDGHVMVNFIEPNFQDIIFTLSTVSLITQKWFSDHLKKWHFWGNTPYHRNSFWLGGFPLNYSRITGILRKSCSRQKYLHRTIVIFDLDHKTMAGAASASTMGCGGQTPSTQHIAVTLTPLATRQCAGSNASVHHSLSKFMLMVPYFWLGLYAQ